MSHSTEVMRRERFEFGENWAQFLTTVDSRRIAAATASLERMLGQGYLQGKKFLDVGSGSGLFSLAARTLGADVHSFDYDPLSVACASELRQRYFANDVRWQVEEGSALDPDFLGRLGQFDVVYSWGVLHHTGSMWEAMGNLVPLVSPYGRLCIAIYNDQGRRSRYWKSVKRAYCKAPRPLRTLIALAAFIRLWGPVTVRDLAAGKPNSTWNCYLHAHERGMSPWRDVVDWVGGYPFEVAKPEEIFDFYHARGFQLAQLKTCAGGLGCNEFVFARDSST